MNLPIRFVFTAMAGFDIGLTVNNWRRWWRFMLYREMEGYWGGEGIGPWRLAIFFSKRGLDEFYEGSTK